MKKLNLFAFFFLMFSSAFAQNLYPDNTFGNAGKVRSLIRNMNSRIYDVAIQNDGKIIAAGILDTPNLSYSNFLLVRYNVDGSIDSTFGINGAATKRISVNTNLIESIAIQSDGKIVAGGSIQQPFSSEYHFTIVRFNNNGSVDSSFGSAGLVTISFKNIPDEYERLKQILMKPDGKILIGGYSYNAFLAGSSVNTLLTQLKENGSLDSTFGTNGKVVTSTGTNASYSRGFSMTLRNNKIIAGGAHLNSFAPRRYNSNGSLDSTFGTNGFGDTTTSFTVNKQVLQSDGKIIFVGSILNNSKISVLRYKSNGTFDSTFGVNGKVITDLGSGWEDATAVQADMNDRLLVSGYTNGGTFQNPSGDFALLRYNTNGILDTAFGNAGIILTDFSGEDYCYSSVFQQDGKIILAGASRDTSRTHAALARYSYVVMPLKLLGFTAIKEEKVNLLNWSTAQEVNLDQFEIERSTNGRDFSKVGQANAGTGRYIFKDATPLQGLTYYRLKMINKDGSFEYSMVRMINNANKNVTLIAYPLPAKGKINLQLTSSKPQQGNISITDILSKPLILKSILLNEGTTNTAIDIQTLPKGIYFLKVVTTSNTETKKIAVQ
jgi:uncharacterized delta-60 repeat protein